MMENDTLDLMENWKGVLKNSPKVLICDLGPLSMIQVTTSIFSQTPSHVSIELCEPKIDIFFCLLLYRIYQY